MGHEPAERASRLRQGPHAHSAPLHRAPSLGALLTLWTLCAVCQVFVATDDIKILPNLRACTVVREHGWTLHSFEGNPPRSEYRASIYRMWAEFSLLIDATYAVGTYTSNVGRRATHCALPLTLSVTVSSPLLSVTVRVPQVGRLIQVMRYGKAPETMTSVDGAWFPGRL